MTTKQTNNTKSTTRAATTSNKAPKRLFAAIDPTDGTLDGAEPKKKDLYTYGGNVIGTYELVSVSKPISSAKSRAGYNPNASAV